MDDVKEKNDGIDNHCDSVLEHFKGHYNRVQHKIVKLLDGHAGRGHRNAAFYDYLMKTYIGYKVTNELNSDGFMFLTSMRIEKEFHINKKMQYRIFTFLEEIGLIETYIFPIGTANKRIKLHFNKMNEYLNMDFNDVPTIKMRSEDESQKRQKEYAEEKEIKKTLSKQLAEEN